MDELNCVEGIEDLGAEAMVGGCSGPLLSCALCTCTRGWVLFAWCVRVSENSLSVLVPASEEEEVPSAWCVPASLDS